MCISLYCLPAGKVRYDVCSQHGPTVSYDSDFASQFCNVDEGTSTIIREYIQTHIPWAAYYRAAVDEVIASPDVHSGPAFVEFVEVNRETDGPVIGQRVSSNEIAAIV